MLKTNGMVTLVAEPELKEVANTVVVNLRVVSNEYRKVNGETQKTSHYFDMKAWDTAAKTIAQHARKGGRIVVEAIPRTEEWKDKEGNPRSKTVFRIVDFSIIDFKNAETKEENESVVANG